MERNKRDHKKAIDKGIAQLENGEGIPHKEVMKKYGKWLKRLPKIKLN